MQVFVITDVGIVSFHLSFDHRLLASAAGNHQTDEERLQTKSRVKGEMSDCDRDGRRYAQTELKAEIFIIESLEQEEKRALELTAIKAQFPK